MSQHARIEELSDSDSDPSEMDPSDFDPQGPAIQGQRVQQAAQDSIMDPRSVPASSETLLQPQMQQHRQPDPEMYKSWHCIYPIYFDSTRSKLEGRRVGKSLAVENPLAREIVDAVQNLQLRVVFEPGKTHPKDWANPGRVKVDLEHPSQKNIKNKHHLYILIATHLKSHPTTKDSPLRLKIQGMPLPKEVKGPEVPKGWKMNTIIPLHSPAMTGGGVSENFLKDMMAEMGGNLPPGVNPAMLQAMGGAGGGGVPAVTGGDGGAKKKDKKKGKA